MVEKNFLIKRISGTWKASNISQLFDELSSYFDDNAIEAIKEAYKFSESKHNLQKRKSGEPYINHPVAVAITLAKYRLDVASIKAALLHDVVEDTSVKLEEIKNKFGDDVATIVDGVSKLDKLEFKSAEEAQAESFRKMILAMTKDLRVILVKLADRLHNIKTIESMSIESRKRKARETLEIYAPIANRLGIYELKVELEDLGFKAFSPYRYKVLQKAINIASSKQKKGLLKTKKLLLSVLNQHGLDAEINIREKHLYSIYSKMKKKHANLSDILDVYGLRIVINNDKDCYRALGLVHQYFKPISGTFKDYIAIPRVNGYQSLHTTLFGPNGLPLEVQIRTREMDWVAERGVASHWQYKATDKSAHSTQFRAREWLNALVAMQKNANSEEFLEAVKIDLFPDKVYVFSPKGEIVRLPKGSTPLDFAYEIHTDLGNSSVSSKVDRKIVPLKYPLSNGNRVEIITSDKASPNPEWITFVATAKARNAIRNKLRDIGKDDAIFSGTRLLARALYPHGIGLRKLQSKLLDRILAHYKLEAIEDLYENIGNGKLIATLVATNIVAGPDAVNFIQTNQAALEIRGTEGLSTTYGNCCLPLPGDEIIGFISSGKGIVIHRANCKNVSIFRKDASRWLSVEWGQNIKREFMTDLTIRTLNKVGALADIAGKVSSLNSNIVSTNIETQGDSTLMHVRLSIKDRRHLADLLRRIRTVNFVTRVNRGHTQ
jgi:guanosine-3',5'-bis(diphosphate) 3'-pyrophosphohydrolase